MVHRVKQLVVLVVVIAAGYYLYTKFVRDLSAKSDEQLIEMYGTGDFADSKAAEIELDRRMKDNKLSNAALYKQLDKSDGEIKGAAAEWLGRNRTKDAPAKLIKVLKDSSPKARTGACRAFQYLRSKEAVDILINLLEDGDDDVRQQASAALTHYTGGEVKYKQFGKAQWREWWSTEKNTFRPPGD
ncbi:MAG: HEAT repeat domain-containing protein [Planctomycetota bacterium]|nr:HEAT repeat domain-containing protein [Planctomycetota bacterium]